MTRRNAPPEEQKRQKAQRQLEALDYTPLAARFLSGMLRALAKRPDKQVVLECFRRIASEP